MIRAKAASISLATWLLTALLACTTDEGGGGPPPDNTGTDGSSSSGSSSSSSSSSSGSSSSGSSGSGADAGSAADGGPLSAGPGQFNYRGAVNGQSIAGSCTPKGSAAVDSYAVVIAGSQLNIACPGAIGTAVANPAASLILKAYAGLPGTFSFNAAEGLGLSRKYEVTGWMSSTGPRLQAIHANVQSIEVKGTYDPATKHVTGTVVGKWGTPTKPDTEAEGWLEIAFDVTHP